MENNLSQTEQKYKIWIIILSIVIPIAVAFMFTIKLKDLGFDVTPLKFLPPIYAAINGTTAVLLVLAITAIKNGKRKLHENLMKSAIACSVAFLLMYVAYHLTTDRTEFGGVGIIRTVYRFILATHIILSIIIIPLVLVTYVRALAERFDKHKKIARITFPIWLYVAVTGVIVYFMISPYYV
jgi:putative membrane protein